MQSSLLKRTFNAHITAYPLRFGVVEMMHTPIVRLCEMDSRDGPCENLKYIDTIARNGNCPWINLFCLTTKMSETGLVIHRESKSILIGLGYSLPKSPLESIVYCRDLLKHSTWKRGGGVKEIFLMHSNLKGI